MDYAAKKGFKEAAALIADASGVDFDTSTVAEQAAPVQLSPTPVAKASVTSMGVSIQRPPTPPEL